MKQRIQILLLSLTYLGLPLEETPELLHFVMQSVLDNLWQFKNIKGLHGKGLLLN